MTQTLPRLLVVDTRSGDHDGTIKLLSEILTYTVRLPGASCVGRHELFDPVVGNGLVYRDQERARLTKAATVCATCPVQMQCTTMVTSSVTSITAVVAVRRSAVPARPRFRHSPGTLPLAQWIRCVLGPTGRREPKRGMLNPRGRRDLRGPARSRFNV
jgi:hypothetical protein